MGEKPVSLFLCKAGVIVVTDKSYLIYNRRLDYKLIDINEAKMILESEQLICISNDITFFDLDEAFPCSLKQKKVKDIEGRVKRLIKISDSLICYLVTHTEINELFIYDTSNDTVTANLISEVRIETLHYSAESNSIIAGGSYKNQGILEFYTLSLEKIVSHEFPAEVTALCALDNILLVACTCIIFCLEVTNVNLPEKICVYKSENRINSLRYYDQLVVAATEGNGIMIFSVVNNIIAVAGWSRTREYLKSVVLYDHFAVGIDLQGNVSVLNMFNKAFNSVFINNGGRVIVEESITSNNIIANQKILTVCCLNGEIFEIQIRDPDKTKEIYDSVVLEYQKKMNFPFNPSEFNLNLLKYYYKLPDDSKAALKSKYTGLEDEIEYIK